MAISSNISSVGPVTLATVPMNHFHPEILENLSMRAFLSTGVGETQYYDRVFSSRIYLPKIEDQSYEALIYTFISTEDREEISLKPNSKSLSMLIFIYERSKRNYVSLLEEDLEKFLNNYLKIPTKLSELTTIEVLNDFVTSLRSTTLRIEQHRLPEEVTSREIIKFRDDPISRILGISEYA